MASPISIPQKRNWWAEEGSRATGWLLIGFGSLGVLTLAVLIGVFLNRYWRTSGETRAAIHALDCLKSMDNVAVSDATTYSAVMDAAQKAVKQANDAAVTVTDHRIADMLAIMLDNRQNEHKLAVFAFAHEAEFKGNPQWAVSQTQFERSRQTERLQEDKLRQSLSWM
jgi:hypothetical protein